MTLKASGKGISAAVRDAIPEWMTSRTVDALFGEYVQTHPEMKDAKTSFELRIQMSDEWVRKTRRRGYPGWVRGYYSKRFTDGSVQLEVVTNGDDTEIEYVTVKIGRKIVGGGKVRVPSVFESQRGRDARLKIELAFDPFTEAQLAELQAQMEFGEEAAYAMIFADRTV